jgi:hypothetical protein
MSDTILSPVITIVTTFLDCGSTDDSAFFQLFPRMKKYWLKYYNFKHTEKKFYQTRLGEYEEEKLDKWYHFAPSYYITTTTIDIDNTTLLHSVDDIPAFIKSYIPWSEIESNGRFECNYNQIELLDWGSFGYLHRKNKPARKFGMRGCDKFRSERLYDFYFVDGLIFRENSLENVVYNYCDDELERWKFKWWYAATKSAPFVMMKIGERWDYDRESYLFGGVRVNSEYRKWSENPHIETSLLP